MGAGQLPETDGRRATHMLVSDIHLLRTWGHELERMFPDAIGVLHVGSSLVRPNYRDVDVRIVLDDETFRSLCTVADVARLNIALSIWGQRATSLPIDCQVQGFTAQQNDHGNKPRSGMGVRPEFGLVDPALLDTGASA